MGWLDRVVSGGISNGLARGGLLTRAFLSTLSHYLFLSLTFSYILLLFPFPQLSGVKTLGRCRSSSDVKGIFFLVLISC